MNEGVCTRLKIFGKQVRELLLRNGWEEKSLERASTVLVNSCNFLESIEQRTLGRINKVKSKLGDGQECVVIGCQPVTGLEKLEEVHDGESIGGSDLNNFARKMGLEPKEVPVHYTIKTRKGLKNWFAKWFNKVFVKHDYLEYLYDKERAYHLKISEGCLGDCTYCSERFARGCLKSRSVKNVINEFEQGLRQGYKIFSLNADDTGVYGLDKGENVCELLEAMLGRSEDFSLMITEFNPLALQRYPELISLLGDERVKHVTVPLQSGSKKVLERMNRPYDPKLVVNRLKRVREENPGIMINTHVIVGFPGESYEDFNQTMELFDELEFNKVKIFCYSERPGTRAARMSGKLTESVKRGRQRVLRNKVLTQCFLRGDWGSLLLNLYSPLL